MEYSKEQLQMLLDCMPGAAAIYILQDCGLTSYLRNEEAAGLSGITGQDPCGRDGSGMFGSILPEDQEIVRKAVSRIISGGISDSFNYRVHTENGKNIWVHAQVKWIGQYEGKKVLLAGFSDLHAQIAENTPGGFFIYAAEENDQFYFVNQNMLNMLGYDREGFRKKFQNRFRFMVYQEDREETLRSIDEQIAEKGFYDTVEYRIEKGDGSLIWVHDEGHFVVDRDGRPWFYVTIGDISPGVAERQELLREKDELGRIIRNIPIGISVYRAGSGTNSLMVANQEVCDELGITLDELRDNDYGAIAGKVHPDDLFTVTEMMKGSVRSGRHFSKPFRYRDGAGWKWLKIISNTITEQDQSAFVYNVVTNLTTEKLAEEKLEEAHIAQQKKFREDIQALLFANPRAVCSVRLNLSVNRFLEGYGTSAAILDAIRADTADGCIRHIQGLIISDEDRKQFLIRCERTALLKSYFTGETQFSVRYLRRGEKDEAVWIRTQAHMVENPETHEIEAVLYSEDVSEQVMNEQIIGKITADGYDYISLLHFTDEKYYKRFGNGIHTGAESEGIDYREAIDYAVRKWVHPDAREEFFRETAAGNIVHRLREEGSFTITIKSQRPDRTEGWKQIRMTWLNETMAWVLIQQTDVTEIIRKQQTEMQERLNTEKMLRQEADKANRAKSDFLSSVSHDMRTPLNAILGYGNLALDTDDAGQQREYLRKIEQAGHTLRGLINDTLDLRKIEYGAAVLHPEPVACSKVVQGILTAVEPMMKAKGIHFTFDNSRAVMAMIYADEMRIEEIFINLLSNAAKFTPPGGHILFSVECEKETAESIRDRLVVKDDGIGISEEFLPKIFEPFTQDSSENTDLSGSGLGLSIVRRLVELMNGTIEVKSRRGEGSEFTVCLEFSRAEQDNEADSVRLSEQDGKLKGKKILVCEDNAMNREIAEELLAKKGIRSDAAVNGKEGLEKFEHSGTREYAAVLMDIRMPVMDGYAAAKAIRACGHPDAETVPIIALTADAYDTDAEKAKDAGMNGHLSKPVDIGRVLEEILKYMPE